MANTYPNLTGRPVQAGALSLCAVAEDALSSSFGSLEDCAETTLKILISDAAGAQIAAAELLAVFYFEGGAYRFAIDDRPDFLTAPRWLESATAAETAALYEAAGGPANLDQAIETAAASVCALLEPAVRGLHAEDTAPCYDVPQWALPYLFNGNSTDLSSEEIRAADSWYAAIQEPGRSAVLCSVGPESDGFFSSVPAFGLPAQCERVAVCYL